MQLHRNFILKNNNRKKTKLYKQNYINIRITK